MRRLRDAGAILALCLGSSACKLEPSSAQGASVQPRAATAAPAPVERGVVRFVSGAGTTPVAQLVQQRRAEVERAHGSFLVYVGATWCEPCQYFHHAVEAHALDAAFPGLVLLEFDLDRDGDRLRADGYAPQMIPLFVVPDANGRPSSRQMEGSIRGPDSVQEIVPRLQGLLR